MRNRMLLAVLLAAAVALPWIADALGTPATTGVATRIAIYAIAAASLNLILGYGGLVSFGHAAYFGLGGYTVGILWEHFRLSEPFLGILPGTPELLITFPAAILVGGVAAAAIGALSLRTSGVQFIMITLAFAQLVYYVGSGLEAYGGDDGLNISRSRFPGLIDLRDKASFYWLCFALLCASLWFCGRYANSHFGLVLRGAKSNELRMTALGFPVFRYRLAAFTISGALGGLSGILLANEGAYISPAMMSWMKSGDLIVIVVLGGMGTLFGPLYGTIAFFVLEEARIREVCAAHPGIGAAWLAKDGTLQGAGTLAGTANADPRTQN